MNYWNLDLALLRAEEVLAAEVPQIGTWVMLMGYCLEQENGGIIPGCGLWTAKQWSRLGLDPLILRQESSLWSWDEDDLCVWAYPTTHESAKKIAARENGKKGGRPKKPTEETQEKTQETHHETQEKNETDKEKKDKEKKDKESLSQSPLGFDGTDGVSILTLADALQVAARLGIPADCATKWFMQSSVRLWLDAAGKRIIDREAALVGFAKGWEKRERAEAAAQPVIRSVTVEPEPDGWRAAVQEAGYEIEADVPWTALPAEARAMALNLTKKSAP